MRSWTFNADRRLKNIAAAALLALFGLSPVESVAVSVPAEVQAAAPEAEPVLRQPETNVNIDPASAEPLTKDETGNLLSGTRALGSLIFILAAILITMVLLKRYMPHRFGPLGHKRRIQVLETVPIGEKRSLILVEIGGNALLLASTPTSVSLLKEMHSDGSTAIGAKSGERAAAPPAETLGTQNAIATDNPEARGLFKEALAMEVWKEASARAASPLARISRIRAELEAR